MRYPDYMNSRRVLPVAIAAMYHSYVDALVQELYRTEHHAVFTDERFAMRDSLGIERVVDVHEVEPDYLPTGVLAWTNGKDKIVMRNDLDKLAYRGRIFVLEHEKAHIYLAPDLKRDEGLADSIALRRSGLSKMPF